MNKPKNKSVHIRPAKADEAELLSSLAIRSKAYWGYSKEFLKACRKELSWAPAQIEAPECNFMVAEIEEKMVGFYALEQLSETEFELEALFVKPELIGCGIGRTLIEHAKHAALVLGGKTLLIQGDPHAESFYCAAGGEQTGVRESKSIAGRYLPVYRIPLKRSVT